jgi:ABC-type glutathione transport system ATPase component
VEELISARGITVGKRSAHSRVIINDVSLNVHKNEILGIVGESGSGKTTTALALTGMLPASLIVSSGVVLYSESTTCNERDVYAMNPKETSAFLGKETAFIFQDPSAALNPVQRIGTQIAERLVIFSKRGHTPSERLSKTESEERALDACNEAGLPATRDFLQKYPHELSGGMKQRAMIASAIVHAPRFIIADEPTASLDALTAKGILELLRRVQEKLGCGIVFISHDLDAVRGLCSRLYVLHQGSVVETASVEDFFVRPHSEHAKELVKSLRIINAPRKTPHTETHASAFETLATIDNLSARYINRGEMYSKSAKYLQASQTKKNVLHHISFSIGKQEVVGLIGQSGSGKTTLARCLSGIIPYTGSFKMDGEEFSALSRKDKSRLVQIVFQNPYTALNPSRTIQSLVEEPLVIHHTGSKRERAERVREMLSAVSLDESFLRRYPDELSGGERQRAAIAAALMLSPKLLVADEILSALDITVQLKIIDLLSRLKERFGFSILFITHNISQALSFCDKIAVMKDGRIMEFADARVIAQGGAHEYTQELLKAQEK